ncbi:disulfide bond formation protein DsbD [Vibrio cholerae]|nr:disulfide bond formation protein DsbD [Vibrio cholerae]
MVAVVVFEFGGMRCQPLRRALCLITKKISWLHHFFAPLACEFCVCRQVGFSGRCFPDTHSLALEIQRIASINFRISARLVRLSLSIF